MISSLRPLSTLICLLSLGVSGAPAFAKTKAPKAAKSAELERLKLVEGDEKGNEIKSLKAELLVSASEQRAVAQLQKLIQKYKGSALEPELHFRLAELYMRRSKTDRFFEVHRESDTVVHLAPRVAKEASSKKSVSQAVSAYQTIEQRFPEYSQMDLVIFNHAFAMQILGDDKGAEGLYWQLVSKYPQSPLVPDGHLAIGEIAFSKGQLTLALEHFNAIKKFPESRVYPYGLYKAAWTYYNMRDAEKGLRKLEEVVAYGKFVAQNKIEARLDLRKEALSDMTLFYEDVYPSSDAFKYFREQAGDLEVGPIVLRMGTLYERHSRFEDQRTVLDQFVAASPKSPLLPQVHLDLVLAHDHLRKKDQAVMRLEQFAQLCAADGSWVRGLTKNEAEAKKLAGECTNSLNDVALRMAKKWLKAWKKLPSDTTYADSSERAFAIYLRTPGQGEEFATSKFAYAELLFARSKFRQASQEYSSLSRTGGGSAQINHDASYGALISLEKAVGDKWSGDDEKTFHQLAQEYVSKNPKGAYRLDIEYKMALLAYEKERYAEAAPSFLRLGREYPDKEKGIKAQDLYLDILNIKKDYAGIRTYTQEVLKLTQDQSRTGRMRKLYEQAYFLDVQNLEDKGQNKEALQGYTAFIKQNPNSEFSEKATWNAMLLHYKVGDTLNGAKMSEEFATRYPTSAQSVNALMRSAQTFEQMGQLNDAGRVLEKLAIRDVKSARRWHELAADFFTLSGDLTTARRLYGELKVSGDPAQKTAILNKLEILEKNYGTEQTHNEILKVLVDQNVAPFAGRARVEAVEKLLAKGNVSEAFAEARRHMGSGSSSNEKARLRMVQAKILEDEFLKQSVKSRAERVAAVLALKTEKLEKVQEALQSTIKYGDPKVSTEAFEHLYSCYAHYVKALKEMPVPVGVSEEDAKTFRAEVDKLVIPLEEKSVDTLAQALNFARKQIYLDGTISRLEAQLSQLNQQPYVNLVPDLAKPEPMLPIVAEASP